MKKSRAKSLAAGIPKPLKKTDVAAPSKNVESASTGKIRYPNASAAGKIKPRS